MYLIPIPIPLRTDAPSPPKRRRVSILVTHSPSPFVDDKESDAIHANEKSSECHRSNHKSAQDPKPLRTFGMILNARWSLQHSFQHKSDDRPEKLLYWSNKIYLVWCACSEDLRLEKLLFRDAIISIMLRSGFENHREPTVWLIWKPQAFTNIPR